MKYADMRVANVTNIPPEAFTCPHCGTSQKISAIKTDLNSLELFARQCVMCSDFTVWAKTFGEGDVIDAQIYPSWQGREPATYHHCDPEVLRLYEESCRLTPVSPGAAGAYARKTVELILEKVGYGQAWLAQKIDAAAQESDPDKKLPKRLIDRLNYLKETGNFGVHIRRNTASAEIVEVDDVEVEACLDTVEELIQFCFEQPGEDAERRANMNAKLTAAGKKPL